jgi:hypothetical protein
VRPLTWGGRCPAGNHPLLVVHTQTCVGGRTDLHAHKRTHTQGSVSEKTRGRNKSVNPELAKVRRGLQCIVVAW